MKINKKYQIQAYIFIGFIALIANIPERSPKTSNIMTDSHKLSFLFM